MSIGYQKGDAIAIFMENHPKFMVVILALAKIGAVASLINNHLTQEVNPRFSQTIHGKKLHSLH